MSYYRILGVSEDASDSDITRAYRRLIKKLHPDTNPGDPAAAELFKEHYNEVVVAYGVLSDTSKRQAYDEARGPRARAPAGRQQWADERQPPPRRSATTGPTDRRAPQDRGRTTSDEPPAHRHRQRPGPEPARQPPPRRSATSGPGRTQPARPRLEPKQGRHRGPLDTALVWLLLAVSFGVFGFLLGLAGRALAYRMNWSTLFASLAFPILWGGALWLWSAAEKAAEKGRYRTAVVVVVLQVILLAGLLPVTGIGLAYGVGLELSPTAERVLGVVGSALALAWGWIGLDILKNDYRNSEPGEGESRMKRGR